MLCIDKICSLAEVRLDTYLGWYTRLITFDSFTESAKFKLVLQAVKSFKFIWQITSRLQAEFETLDYQFWLG